MQGRSVQSTAKWVKWRQNKRLPSVCTCSIQHQWACTCRGPHWVRKMQQQGVEGCWTWWKRGEEREKRSLYLQEFWPLNEASVEEKKKRQTQQTPCKNLHIITYRAAKSYPDSNISKSGPLCLLFWRKTEIDMEISQNFIKIKSLPSFFLLLVRSAVCVSVFVQVAGWGYCWSALCCVNQSESPHSKFTQWARVSNRVLFRSASHLHEKNLVRCELTCTHLFLWVKQGRIRRDAAWRQFSAEPK